MVLNSKSLSGTTVIPSITSSKPLLLNNVLFVPHITKSLLSISKFTLDNNVFLEFHTSSCFVKDKLTNKILLEDTLKDGLYQLDISNNYALISSLSPSSSTEHTHQANLSGSSSKYVANLWHSRLGHPCKSVLDTTLKKLNVSSKSCDISFSNACAVGKTLHELPFYRNKNHCTFTINTYRSLGA